MSELNEALFAESNERLKTMIQELSASRGYKMEEIDNGFVIDVPVTYEAEESESGKPETRQQFVYLTANRLSAEGDVLFQVFTICAPEDERFYRSAMLLNMNLPFGAFAIAEVEGTNYFVLVDTYPVKDATVPELEKSISTLAAAGDRMERMLIGADIS